MPTAGSKMSSSAERRPHRCGPATRGLALALILAGGWAGAARAQEQRYDLGRAPTPAELAGWDIDVRGGDGKGLPPGRGTVAAGEKIFAEKCASCHGDFGEGTGLYAPLAGGKGTLKAPVPQKTVGSYWPYAPTLFDYIRRAMPITKPGSLSDDETYAVIAYILNLNDLLPQDGSLDAAALAAVRMPNRDGFTTRDPRPDVKNAPCMSGCLPAPPHVVAVAPKELAPDAAKK
jgi:S-disulfanyl-L-cysteine oxidoreductase SoxD